MPDVYEAQKLDGCQAGGVQVPGMRQEIKASSHKLHSSQTEFS